MWNRKHVEFVWFDEIEWQPLKVAGLPDGLHLRVLSVDESDGALSGIVKIPAGWRFDQNFTASAAEELFILNGDLNIAGEKLTEQFYSYRPSGAAHGQMFSETGCEAIVMWNKTFTANIGEKGTNENVKTVNTIRMFWEKTVAEGPAAGIKVKRLREVAETGEMTFIVGIMPNWYEDREEHHPCVEESFKIFGDMNLNTRKGDRLVMGENSYFFRPPFIKHGPLFTRKGTMSLVRTSSTLINRYERLEDDPEYLALEQKPELSFRY